MALPHTPTTPSRRTRRTIRACAWALMATAVVLAVAWAGSMRYVLVATVTPTCQFVVSSGAFAGFLWDDPGPRRNAFSGFPSPSLRLISIWDHVTMVWWFGWERSSSVIGYFQVWAPLWLFVLATGVPGVWLLVKTRGREHANRCAACGYDRTGLPTINGTAAPCPECGKGA